MKDSVCFSKQNEQPFGQIGAFGDEENVCVFFSFGYFSLVTSQITREK